MADDRQRVGNAGPGRLGWTRRGAFLSILTERIWPMVLGLASLIAVFLVLSWFGIFALLPALARGAVLLVLAALALFVLWRARGIRLPTGTDVDARIEAVSRLRHQPLRTQSDRPTGEDPFALALWREHQKRMAGRLENLSGGAPNTRTERLDPLGLRAVLAMLFVTAFAFSFGSGGGRLGDAFAPAEAEPGLSARVDAWVTPPAYTGRPPIFLTDAAGATDGPVTAPEGSVLSVRISDGSDASLTFTPADGSPALDVAPVGSEEAGDAAGTGSDETAQASDSGPAPDGTQAPAPAAGPREYEYPLTASGSASLATTFSTLGAWSFEVTPDDDPAIAFDGEPTVALNGALELAYVVTDDYGVRQGSVDMKIEDEVADGARPLIAAPEIKLAMPRRTKGEAKGRTSADLTDSPYAGATVALTLVATDDAGQTGRSESLTMTLPERRFTNPLARAVIEQRRILALDANAAPRVTEMLDAVTLWGEEFIDDPTAYLALRAVRTRIATAYDDETLISAVDFMWDIALGIEDGNLSLAERRLRDAREQLSEALENGASDEEIGRLMQELREAMQEYMQALAEAMRNMPPMSQDQMQMGDMQEIRPQDLDRMLDQIEDLAKSGSKEAAQQLLSELQQMMDNLQAMRPGQQQQGGEQNAMQQQMDKMGEMLRRQQELMDQTFELGRQQMQRQQQGQQQPGQQGEPGKPQQGGQGEPMTAEQLQEMLEELQRQQGQLQQDLEAMQQELEGMGMQPSEDFGEAGEAMGEAEGALGRGEDGEAVGQQGRAMEAMRRGAQDMMQQMQQAMQGQGQQPGQQGRMGQGFGPGRQQNSGRDPLGRQRQTQGPDFGQDVGVPDEIDTQRAREILDAIRERLGDALSPQLEREYLERLLQTP